MKRLHTLPIIAVIFCSPFHQKGYLEYLCPEKQNKIG